MFLRTAIRNYVTEQVVAKGMAIEVAGAVYGADDLADGGADVQEGGDLCVVCQTDPRDCILMPCRHLCLCLGCERAVSIVRTGPFWLRFPYVTPVLVKKY